MEEIYRDISGYEGMYQCSNLGNVKAVRREYISGNGSHKWTEEKLLKQQTNKNGYKRVSLCKDGKHKWFFVHRLVVDTFQDVCGELKEGLFVNHKDENPSNNHVDNLEVCTTKYNINYGSRTQKATESRKKYFDKRGRKWTREYKIQYLREYHKKKRAV